MLFYNLIHYKQPCVINSLHKSVARFFCGMMRVKDMNNVELLRNGGETTATAEIHHLPFFDIYR